jgi:hypothetical protein
MRPEIPPKGGDRKVGGSMVQTRIWPLLGLSLMMPAVPQAAWSDPVGEGSVGVSAYLCQFGNTVNAYNFMQDAEGQWLGLGPLEGWSVVAQADGLVAQNSDQLLVIGDGPDSLVQGGQVVQGECADARNALPQLFGEDAAGGALDGDPGEWSVWEQTDPLAENNPELSEQWVAGILAIFSAGAWDEGKVAALVDALSLERSLKLRLKAELKAAGRDPVRVAGIARQIQRFILLEAAATADLRAKLQETRRELAAVTDALHEQRKRAEDTSKQLAAAKAKASAAERANTQTTARLEAAQRALREKDAELARAARDMAALRQQFAGLQAHQRETQAALDAALAEQQGTNLEVAALIQQLTETRARLARANKKIEELQALRN